MKKVLKFLTQLKANNNREWFNDNKHLFIEAKDIFEGFVNVLILKIKEFDSSVNVDTAKECIFRIYRDVRFSKNKEPYKPNMGAYIASGGRKSKFAGYYIHIEPGVSFVGGGIYCPKPDVLKIVREDIFENSSNIKTIINNNEFKAIFPEMYGEKLKTAPRGFPKDFPDIDLLNFKSYTVIKNFSDNEVAISIFLDNILKIYKTQKPFNDYLNKIIKNT